MGAEVMGQAVSPSTLVRIFDCLVRIHQLKDFIPKLLMILFKFCKPDIEKGIRDLRKIPDTFFPMIVIIVRI
jgi:hypothetical protein